MNTNSITYFFFAKLFSLLVLIGWPLSGLAEKQALDLNGYWQDSHAKGSNVLKIEQSGQQVTASFHKGGNLCRSIGQNYFTGNLSGSKFTGTLKACYPSSCKTVLKGELEHDTELAFTVADNCQSFSGSWMRHTLRSCLPEIGSEPNEQWDFNPTRQADCKRVEIEKNFQQEMLNIFKTWAQLFADGEFATKTTSHKEKTSSSVDTIYITVLVNSDGETIYYNNQPVDDFTIIQAMILEQARESTATGASGAKVGGDAQLKYNPLDSTHDCECQKSCEEQRCTDAGIYQACHVHEDLHCGELIADCQKVKSLIDQRQERQASELWESMRTNFAELIQGDIRAYTASIAYMQGILDRGECY